VEELEGVLVPTLELGRGLVPNGRRGIVAFLNGYFSTGELEAIRRCYRQNLDVVRAGVEDGKQGWTAIAKIELQEI